MGLASFWSNFTSPRVKEITPPKQGQKRTDRRPATSSGARTVIRTPSLEDDSQRELNAMESLLTTNIIEPPPPTPAMTVEEKKARRRSRGLSLSRSKNEEGTRKRRSLFGGGKDTVKTEDAPGVPTLPTLSAIYSRQAPHKLGNADGLSVPVRDASRPYSWRLNDDIQVHELPANPAPPAVVTKGTRYTSTSTPSTEREVKKHRRRSIGEVLSGKRKSSMHEALGGGKPDGAAAPPTPALPTTYGTPSKPAGPAPETEPARSRRNSNASVASKASKASKSSRKSRRTSWFQRRKGGEADYVPVPPMPPNIAVPKQKQQTPVAPAKVEIVSDRPKRSKKNALAGVPTAFNMNEEKELDDTASIRTTRSEKSTARLIGKSQSTTLQQRRQSSGSQIRRKRRSWWGSSNPDYSDDEAVALPPVPPLVRSVTTSPETSPTNSNVGSERGRPPTYISVRGDDIKAPRPLSTASSKSRNYTPRSAAKSFLVSTTPVSGGMGTSVRHSLHACQDLDAGAEDDRGTYCLSVEQQREWEKLKHLMAVMDQKRNLTRKAFGEESVADMYPSFADEEEGEEREGVKYSNRDALAALEVGVAH